MGNLRITVLVENNASSGDLEAEHGLSVWIETGGRSYLFDTGQGGALAVNAGVLGIPLDAADAVMLSHGHYDHTGGLVHVLGKGREPAVYLHPAACEPKYSRGMLGPVRYIGMSEVVRSLVREVPDIRWTVEPTEVSGGLFLTGPIPRRNDFEDTGGAFYTDEQCLTPDEMPDDQAAFMDTPDGVVVILGCAHAGVINTIEYIKKISGRNEIRLVMGGMHLLSAGRKRMNRTVDALRELGVRKLFPAHCTGNAAQERLAREFPGQCFSLPAGTVLDL